MLPASEYTMEGTIKSNRPADTGSVWYDILTDATPYVAINNPAGAGNPLTNTSTKILSWPDLLRIQERGVANFAEMCSLWKKRLHILGESTQNAYYDARAHFISGTPIPGGVMLSDAGAFSATDPRIELTLERIDGNVLVDHTAPIVTELSGEFLSRLHNVTELTVDELKKNVHRMIRMFGNTIPSPNIPRTHSFAKAVATSFKALLPPTTPAADDRTTLHAAPPSYVFHDASAATNPAADYAVLPGRIQFDLEPHTWYAGSSPVEFLSAILTAVTLLEHLK